MTSTLRASILGLALGLAASLAAVAPVGALPATAKPAAKPVLPWIEDDYPGALQQARARKLPIFVESWAPW